MMTLPELVTQIRVALATHLKVTIENPKPKRLWRVLKKELPVCDVTFDERAVHVTWKAVELIELSPEERFAESVYESGRKRAEQEAFLRASPVARWQQALSSPTEKEGRIGS